MWVSFSLFLLVLIIYSGAAAVAVDKNLLVVDNVDNGFSLYHFDSLKPLQTLSTNKPTIRKLKQVTFAKNSRIVMEGSDHSSVYVFDRKTEALLDVFRHHEKLVQTVAVSS